MHLSRPQSYALRMIMHATKKVRTDLVGSGRIARGTFDALLSKHCIEQSGSKFVTITDIGKAALLGVKFKEDWVAPPKNRAVPKAS